MTNITGSITSTAGASRTTAALWSVLVFTAGFVLAIVLSAGQGLGLAPGAVDEAPVAAPVTQPDLTRMDDYALRHTAIAPALSRHDDYALRLKDGATVPLSRNDDYATRH